jgi:hypothetical protein
MTEARRWGGPRIAAVSPEGLICLMLLLVALLALAGSASAAPAVTLKVRPLPIPGFPGTGNRLGVGTEVETQVTISGTEYGGFPSPVTEIDLYAPAGFKIASTGFPTCALSALQAKGPKGCPKKSSAGPPGIGAGAVAFGGEQVVENVTIQSFFALGGGLNFDVEGTTPVSLQVIEKSHLVSAAAPLGPELVVEVPLVETVPGAPDASITSFDVKVGAAYRRNGKTVSYLTQSKKCPKGGFTTEMVLKYLSGETSTVTDTTPCPRR